MSWSVQRTGTRDGVAKQIAVDFDLSAKNYAGTEEEKDVLSAKDRALSAVASLKLDADPSAPAGYGVEVSANGSRSDYSVSVRVDVRRVALAL